MCLSKMIPKKFCCRIALQKGALFVGIIMLIISIICVISFTAEILLYKECLHSCKLVMHKAYNFSINAIIYCVIMVITNSLYIWGVMKQKWLVVLSWVVITGIWWIQSFVMVFVMLCVEVTNTGLGWMFAVIGTIIAYMILAYFILVGYGYYLQIWKTSQTTQGVEVIE